MIRSIANCTVGCNIGNMSVNILAYADDIVLLSPSWRGLQLLIDTLFLCVKDINMLCNGRKTVCMVVNPRRRSALVRAVFPSFKLGTIDLQFVPTFRYLGHIVTESLCDNEDIHREIKNLFKRTNSLVRKFSKCSFIVKCTLFRSYCLSLYDIALWHKYTVTCINKLRSCYSKCIKLFFGYHRRDSLTQVLIDTGLPSFDTVMHNSACVFSTAWQNCPNVQVQYFSLCNI